MCFVYVAALRTATDTIKAGLAESPGFAQADYDAADATSCIQMLDTMRQNVIESQLDPPYRAINNMISNLGLSTTNRASFKAQLDELKGGIAEYADRVRSAVSASINSYHSSTDGKNDARLGAAAQGTGEHLPFAQASSPRRNPERGDSQACRPPGD